jgi:hypothetical protein
MAETTKQSQAPKEYKTMAIPEEPGDDEYKTMAIPEEPGDERQQQVSKKAFGEK